MSLDNHIEAVAAAMIREAARTLFSSIAPTGKEIKGSSDLLLIKEAAEMDPDPAENFDNWLPLRLAGTNRYYDYTLQELQVLVNTCRKIVDTNEVAKNIQRHYRNFVVGKHINIDIVSIDDDSDPVKLAGKKRDAKVRKMLENWKIFTETNNFDRRCRDWITRKHRDGEVIQRIFPAADSPIIRFIDPLYIKSPGTQAPYGITFVKDDAETPEIFHYQPEGVTTFIPIKAEEIFFTQANVDMGAPRGIPTFWPCLSNMRRLEKVLVNSSVLAAVQAAITMVRKHKSATSAKVQAMVNKQSDGVARTDATSGRAIVGRRIRPGTVLDAPMNTEYDFPSHSVNASSFVAIAEHEMAHIAANFVLPVDWLLAKEPTDPLTPGSPTVANFETEQEELFEAITEIFWTVQGMMGVNVEKIATKYDLLFNGKRLAVGKALDEARVDEILERIGAQSPQTTASKHGNNWMQERARTIEHRETRQPGEVMPGDAGNTNTADQGQDGTTKKGGGQRSADGDGGKQ